MSGPDYETLAMWAEAAAERVTDQRAKAKLMLQAQAIREAATLRAEVAALRQAFGEWCAAKDALADFERANPNNTASEWERLFYAAEMAETTARAALAHKKNSHG